MAPQPYYAEWSPTTRGFETPSWETLGRVYDLGYDRDLGTESTPVAAPSKMQCKVRATEKDGSALTLDLASFYRHTPIRVVYGGEAVVWTGYITAFDPDYADAPRAIRVSIGAVDYLGIGGRGTVSRTEPDVYEGDFKGWPTDVQDISDDEFGVVTIELFGVINAPAMLPPKVTRNDDTYTNDANFSERALTTLGKVLDVEMGKAAMTADGNLAIIGRYAVPDALIAGGDLSDGAVIHFTSNPAELVDPIAMPWRRASIRPVNPYDEFRNWATTKGLGDTVHTPTAVPDPAPLPVDSIDRTDLWMVSDNWLQANADLLATLYVNVEDLTFESVDVLLWDSTLTYDRATLLHSVTRVLGTTIAIVDVPEPGGSYTARLVLITGLSLKVTSSQVIATVRFSKDGARWEKFLVDNSTNYKLFRLDDAGFGLDAGATLGP
jgi:hypothetical protein